MAVHLQRTESATGLQANDIFARFVSAASLNKHMVWDHAQFIATGSSFNSTPLSDDDEICACAS
jgi:hypothetical protein